MEKAENIKLENDESINDHTIEYLKETKDRVIWLENNLQKLENMKVNL